MPRINLKNIKSIVNESYYPLLFNKDRWLVLYGGAGSGKSVFCATKLLYRCIKEKNQRFLIVRKVARTIRDSCFQEVIQQIEKMGLSELFTVNKSYLSIDCANGNTISFIGLDNPEKIKSVMTPTLIWCEEASELTEEDLAQLNLRMRGHNDHYFQMLLSFNPVNCPIKERFFDDDGNPLTLEDTTIHHSTYMDNRFLDQQYKNTLDQLKDQNFQMWQIYAQGKFCNLEGLIYDNFQHLALNEWPNEYDQIIYGLDFGFNNPSALVRIGIKEERYYLTELLYESGLTNSDLIETIKPHVTGFDSLYCDCAEPDRITELQRAGFHALPAHKNVKTGIDFVKSRTIYYNQTESPNIHKEVQTYCWKKNKDNRKEDEPVKKDDHAMDSVRYAIYTHMGYALTPSLIII